MKSVRIQSFSGPYSVSTNVGKYEPETLQIRTFFTQFSVIKLVLLLLIIAN